MSTPDIINRPEMEILKEVEANESWLLGERLGRKPTAKEVALAFCDWVDAHGGELREMTERRLAGE